jgi:hypothetical protein
MPTAKLFVASFLLIINLASVKAAYSGENILGIDTINIKSSGSVCNLFPANSGCRDHHQNYRFYYARRLDNNYEIRITYSFLNIKITDDSGQVFNSPSVSSEIIDISGLYLWSINDYWRVGVKAGIGQWSETLPGGGYFLSSSGGTTTGISPVIGSEIEWGKASLRVVAGIDFYPNMDDAGTVSIFLLGIRYSW